MTTDGPCTGCRCSLLRRDNGREKLRVILPRICRLPRPADNCHSNKYPLWVSAIDENARSLRPDVWRVNPLKEVCRGIAGGFRIGSGFKTCSVRKTLFASKPAPTLVVHTQIQRGSGLAREGGLTGAANLAGSRQQQIRHRTMPTILAVLIQRAGNLVRTNRQHRQ